MNTEQLRLLATLISLSLCACGGSGGGGTNQSSINPPVSSGSTSGINPPVSSGSIPGSTSGSASGSTSNPVPTISALYPSCAPAGEQFINGRDNQLTVIAPTRGLFVPGSVVRWNGSDRPTASNGSINAITAQISASDIATAGTAAVTVFNPESGGSSNSLNFTITTGAVNPQAIAVDPTGKFAYVMNGGCSGGIGGYVSMYTINLTTGALESIEPPVWTYDYGVRPGSVAVDPSGKFLYVTNFGDPWAPDDGSVAMYTINATTGALTSTGTIDGNCPGLCFPESVVVDPSGKFAYVVSGGVEMYTINATTGALTSIGKIAAGKQPVSVAADPSGKFAYVVNENVGSPGNVSMYALNATTGALTSIGSIATGTNPVSMAVDPSGKFGYVTNSGSNDLSMYTIDATTGALTSIGTIAARTEPVSVAVDPAGKFVYVTNSGSNDVSMYTINSTTGYLALVGTIAAGLSPTSISIHPSAKFVYVTNSGSNDVSMYGIGSTGTLTLIATIGL